jgi:hypothetical protein
VNDEHFAERGRRRPALPARMLAGVSTHGRGTGVTRIGDGRFSADTIRPRGSRSSKLADDRSSTARR